MEPPEKLIAEPQSLRGQVALVTGSSRGLGRTFAHALAEAGAAVAIAGRSASQLTEMVRSITANGGRATAIRADLSNRQAVAQMVATVEEELGPVDVLVNNANLGSPLGPMWELDPDEWRRNIEINLCSVWLCSRVILPGIMKRRHGSIINVSSVAALTPLSHGLAYASSKTAMIRLSQTLAAESKAHGISVFAIHPGFMHTTTGPLGLISPEGQMWWPWDCRISEQGHDIAAEEAGQLVCWLASGKAGAFSGRFFNLTTHGPRDPDHPDRMGPNFPTLPMR